MKFAARLLLALVFVGLVADAATIKIRVTAVPTPSSVVTTEFRDGVDGAFGIWNLIPAQSFATGASPSVNLCVQYLTTCGTGTLSSSIACTPTIGGGLSLSTAAVLSGTTVTAYSGLCRITTTRVGFTLPAISNEFRVEAVAGPSSDTTDPTIVTGCTVTDGTGSSSVTCDAPSDPFDGEAGSGIATVRSVHSVEGASVFALSAGLSKELTLTNVGTISNPGAPTATPSGADWSVTAAGTGMVDGTSDQMAYVNAQVAGAAFHAVRLVSLSGAAANRSAGICISGSTDANAARFALRWQPVESATVGKLQLRGRTTVGGNKVTAATTNTLALPLDVWFGYDGTGTITAYYSTTGNNWVSAGSYSVALGASAYYGPCVSSSTAGTTTTAEFENLNLNNVNAFTRTFTQPGTVTFQATDADGNEAAANASITVAPTIPVDSTPPAISAQPTGTSGGQTNINWVLGTFTDANGIRGYAANLYAGSSCAGSPTTISEQAGNAYGQTGLTANTAYSLRSFAYDPTGNVSALSNCVTATTDAGAPPALTAPTGLAVNCTSTTSCTLTWDAVSGATGYRAQYKWASYNGGYYTNPTTFTSLSAVINDPLDPGITYNFLICALNATEQLCTTSPVNGTTSPASGDAIKWHPGNYTGATEKGCSSTKNTVNTNLVNEVNGLAEFEGTLVIYNWGCLEQGSSNPGGTTAGDYSNGFALIDALLTRAAVGGKRMMILLTTHEYNTASTCDSGATISTSQVPAYANSGGLLVKCPASGVDYKWVSNFGSTAFVDRMKALSAAYGARYNDHPLVESFGFMEETAGVNGLGSSGSASYQTLEDNLYAIHAAAATDWPNTMIKFALSYFGSDAQNRHLVERITTLPNIAFGVGDTYDEVWRSRRTQGNWIYRGYNGSGTDNASWDDRRGDHGFIAEIQSPDIGKAYGVVGGVCTSLTRIYNWAYDLLRHSHIIWTSNPYSVCTGTAFSGGVSGSATTEALAPDSSSGQSNSWTRQKSFIGLGTKVPYLTSCPSAYASCNTD